MSTTRTPSHLVRRVAAACALAVLGALAAPAPPAHAWSEGACAEGAGITVVVDFEGFRDEVLVRCAPAPVESGYDALTKVGLEWTPTQRFPGFLCRIEGFPADDPCVNTPPPDAYWGYWRAEHGGSWAYSQQGPATTSPPPGPVEGWRFSTGDDAPPRVAPPAAAPGEPTPSPSPTASPSASPTPTSSPSATHTPPRSSEPAGTTSSPPAEPTADDGPTTTGTAPDPTTTSDPATPSPDPTDTSPSATGTASATGTPSDPPTATSTDDPRPSSTEDARAVRLEAEQTRPPIATLVGLGLVLALAAGAAVTAYRRRP